MSQEFKKYVFRQTELPAPARQVKDNALNALMQQLADMFSSCDDLFFDLSGRAASNAEQNLYFESMREVRVKKNAVAATFKRELEQAFDNLGKEDTHTAANLDQFSAQSLSLIENDQLEQRVALSSMVTKARSNCQEELHHLNCRFGVIFKHKTINDQNNPLDPQQICQSFAKAAELFELNIKARIILLKQFDRLVVSRLSKLYDQSNQLLINAGILPSIQSSVRKSTASGTTAPASASQDSQSSPLPTTPTNTTGTMQLADLQTLINSLRTAGAAIPSVIAIVPGYDGNAPSLARPELVNSLDNLQPLILNNNASADIRSAIRNILVANKEAGAPKSINHVDEDIINLVAMFFDFVLDDNNIPIAIQALISRLQIPILKLALRDKSFFSDSQHPARALINAMAGAAVGWNEHEKHVQDSLYDRFSQVVHKIIEQYTENDDIFRQQMQELEDFLALDAKKAALIERRASEAAVGKARTNHAKSQVQSLLTARMSHRPVPGVIATFLNEEWQKVMLFVLLRDGENSPQWLDAVQVIDDLMWTSTPHADEKSRNRLQYLIPNLQQRIQQGLSRVAVTEAEAEAIFEQVRFVHDKALSQKLGELAQAIPATATEASAENTEIPGWQQMTAIERQKARYQKLEYEFIKKAESVPIDTWVAFTDTSNGSISRCKLTAKVEVSDSYIFVNRFGAKVVEKNRKQFALELQRGTAQILDRSPLFDRALRRLGDNLRGLSKTGTT